MATIKYNVLMSGKRGKLAFTISINGRDEKIRFTTKKNGKKRTVAIGMTHVLDMLENDEEWL